MNTNPNYYVSGGFGALASAFVVESLEHLIPWLFVIAAIILCDLITGLARCYKQQIKIRFSKAIRDTLAKSCVYFSSIVCAAFVDVASQADYTIDKWICLLICFIEGVSILSNILKWHGYEIDFNKVIGVILKRNYDIEMADSDGIVKKSKKRKS